MRRVNALISRTGKRVYHSQLRCAGRIPTELGLLTAVECLSLKYNKLTGLSPYDYPNPIGKRVDHYSPMTMCRQYSDGAWTVAVGEIGTVGQSVNRFGPHVTLFLEMVKRIDQLLSQPFVLRAQGPFRLRLGSWGSRGSSISTTIG